MKNGHLGFIALLGVAIFATATSAHAAVHRVYPGDSIQAFIDIAAPGDTILVEPGDYVEGDGSERYGLRISTENLRLIAKTNRGKGKGAAKSKVRIIANGEQETGIYAAPAYPEGEEGVEGKACDYDVQDNTDLGQACRANTLDGFYIRGLTVENFPKNGIQTRWVDGFEIVSNESANNGGCAGDPDRACNGNGIYPTLSANGLVRDNVSYGSQDTAMWIAGSENVRVIGNTLYDSVIGFEISVSNNVKVIQNDIFNNTVGVALIHPNGAGNPPLAEMSNWVVEHNDVYNNNMPNNAPAGSFQKILPAGIGILATGVSGHVIAKNNVEGNEYVGIALLGWCTGLGILPDKQGSFIDACLSETSRGSPASSNNLVSQNYLADNATLQGPPPSAFPPQDIVYAQVTEQALGLVGVPAIDVSGNCFKKNRPDPTFFALYLNDLVAGPEPGPLPTDGC